MAGDHERHGGTLCIDGYSLTMEQVRAFVNTPAMQVEIANRALLRVRQARDQVDTWVGEERRVIYGITTGLGKLKDYAVSAEDQADYQRNILLSHAAGLGPFFADRIVRMAMLIRANVLCRAHSGVRPELIERLVLFLNRGLTPQVPQIGSLGVGDLQPMAHLGLSLTGMPEGRIRYGGQVGDAPDILRMAGVEQVEFPLATREALALMSGSTVLLAAAIDAYEQARQLAVLSDAALALTLEAMRGETNAYDPRIHDARGIESQADTAKHVLAMLAGSQWVSAEGRARAGEMQPRVQDAVSLRSSPQIHGAMRDVMQYIESVLARELNASTDNPLLFQTLSGYESLSGGNFHGVLLSYAMDFLAIVLTDAAVLSERRSARLLDAGASYGLPANLAGVSVGLHTGFALVQANAAALVGEMRVLATPASIGSIPAKSNQEDHNSMGMGAVRKALQLIEHFKQVLAVELLCTAQAISLLADQMVGLRLGQGTEAVYQTIRQAIPAVKEDRYMRNDLMKMITLIESGVILKEAVVWGREHHAPKS